MFGKTLKTIIAACFIPIAIGVTKAFFKSLDNLDAFSINTFLIISGFFAYPAFHILFVKPMYIYALGHEIVHVLATWLCGGKVTSFSISASGGSVATTKTNIFIRLSPYLVPIHAIFLFLAYWALRRFFGLSGFFNEFVFLVGFTMSFHIFMTIEVMKINQPDIVKTGYLFSILIIYVANVCVLTLILSIIFREISFVSFLENTFLFLKEIYINIYNKLISYSRRNG